MYEPTFAEHDGHRGQIIKRQGTLVLEDSIFVLVLSIPILARKTAYLWSAILAFLGPSIKQFQISNLIHAGGSGGHDKQEEELALQNEHDGDGAKPLLPNKNAKFGKSRFYPPGWSIVASQTDRRCRGRLTVQMQVPHGDYGQ
jgi:hypothetical protein